MAASKIAEEDHRVDKYERIDSSSSYSHSEGKQTDRSSHFRHCREVGEGKDIGHLLNRCPLGNNDRSFF